MEKRQRLGLILSAVFLVAVVMGAGPGTLLVNQPSTWFGFPRLYVWGVAWCGVEALVVVLAYFLLWRTEPGRKSLSRSEGPR